MVTAVRGGGGRAERDGRCCQALPEKCLRELKNVVMGVFPRLRKRVHFLLSLAALGGWPVTQAAHSFDNKTVLFLFHLRGEVCPASRLCFWLYFANMP